MQLVCVQAQQTWSSLCVAQACGIVLLTIVMNNDDTGVGCPDTGLVREDSCPCN